MSATSDSGVGTVEFSQGLTGDFHCVFDPDDPRPTPETLRYLPQRLAQPGILGTRDIGRKLATVARCQPVDGVDGILPRPQLPGGLHVIDARGGLPAPFRESARVGAALLLEIVDGGIPQSDLLQKPGDIGAGVSNEFTIILRVGVYGRIVWSAKFRTGSTYEQRNAIVVPGIWLSPHECPAHVVFGCKRPVV